MMGDYSRVELHFADGHIEIVHDVDQARKVLASQPSGSVQAWIVSRDDLGIGQPVLPPTQHEDDPRQASERRH